MAPTPKFSGKVKTLSAQQILDQLKQAKMAAYKSKYDYEDDDCYDDGDDDHGEGSYFPSHLLNTSDRAVYVGVTVPDNTVCNDHLLLWEQTAQPDSKTYAFMVATTRSGELGKKVLLFSSKEALEAFDEWWNAYTARFKDGEWKVSFLPRLHEGQEIKGHIISHSKAQDTGGMYTNPGYAFVEDWRWIVSNTKGKVYFNSEFWVFEEASELLAFKLKGDSTKYYRNDDPDDIPF